MNDPAEADVAWRGFSGWAMVPSFGVCVLFTLGLVALDSWFGPEDSKWFRALLAVMIAVAWGAQVWRWFYRTVTFTYRLTDQQIHIDRGWLYFPECAVALNRIRDVRVERGPFARCIGVGNIRMEADDGRILIMPGLWNPEEFANVIRERLGPPTKSTN